MRAPLIRAVLAVYPAAIRERYGDEIAAMLHDSPRPGRDLADTAWCALRDRLSQRRAAMTPARARAAALTLLWLMLTPVGLSVAWIFCLLPLAMLGGPVMELVAPALHHHQVMPILLSLQVLPVSWLAHRLGRATGRSGRVGVAWLAVPLAIGVTVAALAALPDPWPGDLFGGHPAGSGAAVLCWAAGTAVLARAVRTRQRQGRRRAARVLALAGGFAVLDLATAVFVLLAVGHARAPLGYAPLWLPSALTGVDFGLVDGDRWMLGDTVKILPGILTVCTVYTLALVSAVIPDRARAEALSA
ncbi:hypothetical protein [Catellatospora methionotrophica]|uniref:hypothetical protein n=1 Tax=Catellatospora methionotrophica TaxID=121620 RepID=UPI0033EDD8B1